MIRRLATVFLLLAVPLRVYAAVAIMFCGAPAHVPREMQMEAAAMHDHDDSDGSIDAVEHHQIHDSHSEHVQDHG